MVGPADPLPPPEEREHLLDALHELVEARGYEQFVCAPIVLPEATYFPDAWKPDARGVYRLAFRLLRYAGLDDLGVHVELFAEGEVAPGDPLVKSERHRGAAAWFAGIHDGVALFGANVQQLGDPLGVTAAMAHETAHAFRFAHELDVPDLLTEEQLTDLTTVYLGFGVLTTKSTVRHRSANVDGTPWTSQFERTMLGYLAPQSMAFLLACQVAVRGEDAAAIAGVLEADQARYFKQALRWLSANVKDLAGRLGIPERAAWPEPHDLAELTAPLAIEPELQRAESAAIAEAHEEEPGDVPVLRLPESRAMAGAVIGGLLGTGAAIPLWGFVHPVLGLVAIGAAVVAGVRLGRARPAWECSGCRCKVARTDSRCPACNGLFVADLQRPEDRLEIDPWELLRARLGAGKDREDPYRATAPEDAAELEIDPSALDGSELPRVGSVMLCSQDLLVARRVEVETLARRLEITFPPDYIDYVTTLGQGTDTDYVRVVAPAEITATPEPLADGHLVVARTEDDDRIVLRPGDSCELFLLPSDGAAEESLGDRLDDAIEDLLGRPEGAPRWFVPDTLEERFVATVRELSLDAVVYTVLDFGPAYVEREPTHHTILCAAIGGQILVDRIDGAWQLRVATDRRNADTARRFVDALRMSPPFLDASRTPSHEA